MAEATQKHCQDVGGVMHTALEHLCCFMVHGRWLPDLAAGQDILPGPVASVGVDPDLTDPELFRQLFCQKPGIEGDLWVDVPWWDPIAPCWCF